MKIQDYCANENCISIKMRYEYILFKENEYVISYINNKDEIDLHSMPKRRYLTIIAPLIFIVFFLFMIWESMQRQNYFFLSLFSFFSILFFIGYFHLLFYLTNESIIKKERIIKIYKGKIINSLFIKYRDNNNRVKIRRILFMANKHLKESTIQNLKKYGMLNET